MRIKLLFLLLLSVPLFAQPSDSTVVLAPGPQYESNWFHHIFFGKHWRDLWTTPVEAPVLDLDEFAGGITPFKKGGGFQTKTLHFYGSDGKRWKFRSIDKDPSHVLPDEIKSTLLAEVYKDQVSSSNPLAALTVVPILDTLGILQPIPYLCYLPDSPKLGKFREVYKNTLGFIAIHPDESEEDDDFVPYFTGADKVENTIDLFQRFEEKDDEWVDHTNYLKARLIDVWLNDWDRHVDQWKWIRYPREDGTEIWYPYPRDRDQVYAKFGGVFPWVATQVIPQFNSFTYGYPGIKYSTWSGRYIDRRFLTQIDKHTWDSTTTFVHSRLTDELIEDAVSRLPDVHYDIAADELISKLKSRRDKLFQMSEEFFKLINRQLDIYASREDDLIIVNRIDDTKTEVKVYRVEDEKVPRYHRVFQNEYTKDIRIYMQEGDDRVIVRGEVDCSPDVRLIGGPGKDEFTDSSKVNGFLLGVIPLPVNNDKTLIYDSGGRTIINKGPSTSVDRSYYPIPEDPLVRYQPPLPDRGSEIVVHPYLSMDTDNGFIFGMQGEYEKYNFRADPYEYQIGAAVVWATEPEAYDITAQGIFTQWIKNTHVHFKLRESELRFTKYFGYGNATSYDEELYEEDYYRLEENMFSVKSHLSFQLGGNTDVNLGLTYRHSDLDLVNPDLLSTFPFNNYGLGELAFASVNTGLDIDTRNEGVDKYKGYRIQLEGDFFPEILDNEDSFYKGMFDVEAYFNTRTFTDIILALRAGGGKVWGDYPFFEAIYLGGKDNLRGYNRERFSGDAALFGKAELRAYVTDINVVMRGRFGLNAFVETGRVFASNEDSEKWHPSLGGGFWISYFNRAFLVSANAAYSPETVNTYVQIGYGF